jgi:hypothetical protein
MADSCLAGSQLTMIRYTQCQGTDYPANSSVNGRVFAFQKHYAQGGQRAVAGSNYNLVLLSNANTGGKGGVACDVSRDGRTIGVGGM